MHLETLTFPAATSSVVSMSGINGSQVRTNVFVKRSSTGVAERLEDIFSHTVWNDLINAIDEPVGMQAPDEVDLYIISPSPATRRSSPKSYV
jgi:hypothetical protein